MLGVFLQIGGAGFGSMLEQLESMGFFAYVLPFLLIFAVIYAVLSQIEVFKNNRGASVLIAFAVGLLALQLNFVSAFFQDFFPKVGIGIALLIVALILSGAFISSEKAFKWIFAGLGGIIFIFAAVASFSNWQFIGSYWWNQYGALIIVGVVIVVSIIGVILASKKTP